MAVHFHYTDITPFKWKVIPIKKWLESIAVQEHFKIENLSYVFCTDAYLIELNIKYLDHNTYTDILTFDYSEQPESKRLEGEIYISIDRVRENATLFKTTFESELSRVLAHGLLHLIGYKDKNPEEQQMMRAKENYYIASTPICQ